MNKYNIHCTNIVGLGATEVVLSLLPELQNNKFSKMGYIYLPDEGPLSKICELESEISIKFYRRYLPRDISRFIELTLSFLFFKKTDQYLILGDLPMNLNVPQVIFLQNPHIFSFLDFQFKFIYLRYLISRFIFYLNKRFIKRIIVQTYNMKDQLVSYDRDLEDLIEVVSQPPPVWLKNIKNVGEVSSSNKLLKVFYPANNYPHKNHDFLKELNKYKHSDLPVKEILLTIDENPYPSLSSISCVGLKDHNYMVKLYETFDCMIFLSKNESYGLPLVESIFAGIPIICPDLSYSRSICGDHARYFKPWDIESFVSELKKLSNDLIRGWRPDYSEIIKRYPSNWKEVSDKFIFYLMDDQDDQRT